MQIGIVGAGRMGRTLARLAMPRECGDMSGRVVVDVTNNRFGPGASDVYDLDGRASSEVVADLPLDTPLRP